MERSIDIKINKKMADDQIDKLIDCKISRQGKKSSEKINYPKFHTLNLLIDFPYFNKIGKTKGDNNNFAVKFHNGPIGKYFICSPLANSNPFLSNISIVANPNVLPILFAFVIIITSFPAGIVCNISVDKYTETPKRHVESLTTNAYDDNSSNTANADDTARTGYHKKYSDSNSDDM